MDIKQKQKKKQETERKEDEERAEKIWNKEINWKIFSQRTITVNQQKPFQKIYVH